MAKKENQTPKLVLNDVEYDVNKDLNDEQKQMYLHLQNIEDKINSNNFKVKLADGTFTTLTYPGSKNYFLRNGENIIKKSDSFKTIEEAYVKECANLKDSDGHGRIDIVKHKIVDHKVVER